VTGTIIYTRMKMRLVSFVTTRLYSGHSLLWHGLHVVQSRSRPESDWGLLPPWEQTKLLSEVCVDTGKEYELIQLGAWLRGLPSSWSVLVHYVTNTGAAGVLHIRAPFHSTQGRHVIMLRLVRETFDAKAKY
jgi:hypothetical protein